MSSTKVEYEDRIEWHNEKGKLHREDGPAVQWPNGYKEWYLNGERHREDGPAIQWPDSSKFWYLSGKCHRVDGPAIEYYDGYSEYWLKGKFFTKEQWEKEVLKLKLKRLSEL